MENLLNGKLKMENGKLIKKQLSIFHYPFSILLEDVGWAIAHRKNKGL